MTELPISNHVSCQEGVWGKDLYKYKPLLSSIGMTVSLTDIVRHMGSNHIMLRRSLEKTYKTCCSLFGWL